MFANSNQTGLQMEEVKEDNVRRRLSAEDSSVEVATTTRADVPGSSVDKALSPTDKGLLPAFFPASAVFPVTSSSSVDVVKRVPEIDLEAVT
ncbi:MAG: hypothetical protein Q9161_009148 [Pseudevernia consocians]